MRSVIANRSGTREIQIQTHYGPRISFGSVHLSACSTTEPAFTGRLDTVYYAGAAIPWNQIKVPSAWREVFTGDVHSPAHLRLVSESMEYDITSLEPQHEYTVVAELEYSGKVFKIEATESFRTLIEKRNVVITRGIGLLTNKVRAIMGKSEFDLIIYLL